MKYQRLLLTCLAFLIWLTAMGSNRDSLLTLLETNVDDTLKAKIYTELGNQYFRIDKDSARLYYKQAINLYSDADNISQSAYPMKMTSITYAIQGMLDSAIHYMDKTLAIYTEMNDSLNIAFSYNNLGLMHSDNNDYTQSMEYLIKALDYKTKLNSKYPPEKLDIAGTELNIGITYHYIEDYKSAEKYYKAAGESYASLKNSFGVSNINLQLANLYVDLKEYEKASSLFEQLMQENIFDNRPSVLAKLYNNYGALLYNTEDYVLAKEVLNDAFQLNNQIGNNRSAVKNLNNLAEIALLQKDNKTAIEQATKSYQLAKENQYLMSEKTAADILMEAYEKTGNYEQSVKYHKVSDILSDSLYNAEKNKLLTELETKYHTAEKEKELAVKTLEVERVRKSRQLYALLLGLFVFFSVFLYYLYRVRKKRNRELKQLINTKDKLISIIAHDLKNPAIAQKMAIEQLIKFVDKIEEKDLVTHLNALYQSSDSQVTLLHNLLNWAHSQTGHIEYHPVHFNLQDLIRKNIELLYTTAKNKEIEMIQEGESKHIVFADKSTVNTVVRNLLSNAIKFSHHGQRVTTNISKMDNSYLQCTIEDSGIGISAEKLSHLFDLEQKTLSVGTSGEQGSGLGLILCKEMIEKNNGTLTINSIENKTTKVSFTLPLNESES